MQDENEEVISDKQGRQGSRQRAYSTCGSPVYFFGFVGALIYFLSTASGFWVGVLGVLKAIIWPVLVVYELLKMYHI